MLIVNKCGMLKCTFLTRALIVVLKTKIFFPVLTFVRPRHSAMTSGFMFYYTVYLRYWVGCVVYCQWWWLHESQSVCWVNRLTAVDLHDVRTQREWFLFWDVAPCSLLKTARLFRGTSRFFKDCRSAESSKSPVNEAGCLCYVTELSRRCDRLLLFWTCMHQLKKK